MGVILMIFTSKKMKNNLSALDKKALVEKLETYCETLYGLQTDPGTGSLRTLFNIVSHIFRENGIALLQEAAKRFDVDYDGHDTTIKTLHDRVWEERKAASERPATKLSQYVWFLDVANGSEEVRDAEKVGPVTALFTRLRVAKDLGREESPTFRPSAFH